MSFATFIRVARYAAPLAFVAAAACSDDPAAPRTELTPTEQSQLAAILAKPEVSVALLGEDNVAYGMTILPISAYNLQRLGTFTVAQPPSQLMPAQGGSLSKIPSPRYNIIPVNATYRAFGGQFVVSVRTSPTVTEHVVMTGIIGVDDLAQTERLIAVGAFDDVNATPLTSLASTPIGVSGTRTVAGAFLWFDGSDVITYAADSGHVALSGLSFDKTRGCSNFTANTILTTCGYAFGSMTGMFNFHARSQSSGSVFIPATTVTLPATRITVAANEPG